MRTRRIGDAPAPMSQPASEPDRRPLVSSHFEDGAALRTEIAEGGADV